MSDFGVSISTVLVHLQIRSNSPTLNGCSCHQQNQSQKKLRVWIHSIGYIWFQYLDSLLHIGDTSSQLSSLHWWGNTLICLIYSPQTRYLVVIMWLHIVMSQWSLDKNRFVQFLPFLLAYSQIPSVCGLYPQIPCQICWSFVWYKLSDVDKFLIHHFGRIQSLEIYHFSLCTSNFVLICDNTRSIFVRLSEKMMPCHYFSHFKQITLFLLSRISHSSHLKSSATYCSSIVSMNLSFSESNLTKEWLFTLAEFFYHSMSFSILYGYLRWWMNW